MIYYESRPPITARIGRRIWDMLTKLMGKEPDTLWHNWNGIVFGTQMHDADYGAWLFTVMGRPSNVQLCIDGITGYVPFEILEKAGAKY